MENIKKIFLCSLILLSSTTFALDRGIKDHVRGDVISVSTNEEIAKWCDFTKQIVVTHTAVLCVYTGMDSGQKGFQQY